MTFSKKKNMTKKSMTCGHISSGHPGIFGPPTWTSLHMMAQNYPEQPNQETIDACRSFISGLAYMLPCTHCGFHFKDFTQEYLKNHVHPSNGRIHLIQFFVEAHNSVNEHLGESKKWTVDDATNKYTSKETCIKDSVWSGKNLEREK